MLLWLGLSLAIWLSSARRMSLCKSVTRPLVMRGVEL